MGSSAVLRRSSGMLRSVKFKANSGFCNLMMSTWLMLPPAVDGSGKIDYKFQSMANNKDDLSFTSRHSGLPAVADIIKDVEFVGSSHGWLALYYPDKSDLYLENPITDDHHIKLPSLSGSRLGAAHRLILSSSPIEDGSLAFMTFGSRRRLAFCSPHRSSSSNEWTLFGGGSGGDRVYDTLLYSSRHKRLFCISEKERSFRLEGWNVDQHQPPTLDWAMRGRDELIFDYYRWPRRSELKKECLQINYLACAEHSGELFLVVRHVNPRAGPYGSMLDKVIIPGLRGSDYIRTPYKTIDFNMHKIDIERGVVINMENSLGGRAMFVGINHPFAIPAAEVTGVKPDSVYFTDENRLVGPTRLERTTYGGHDNGVFDYRNKEFYPCNDIYPVEYEGITKILPLPLWPKNLMQCMLRSKDRREIEEALARVR